MYRYHHCRQPKKTVFVQKRVEKQKCGVAKARQIAVLLVSAFQLQFSDIQHDSLVRSNEAIVLQAHLFTLIDSQSSQLPLAALKLLGCETGPLLLQDLRLCPL